MVVFFSVHGASFNLKLLQSIICTDDRILGSHTRAWAVDQFFLEIANLPQGALFKAAETIAPNGKTDFRSLAQRVDGFETRLSKVI